LSQLFIDLYLDEDVNVLIADLVRARGFRVTTTRTAGQKGTTDADQLAFATSQGKAILTHNRVDFEALAKKYFEEKRPHSGIIIAVRRHPKELSRHILILLDSIIVARGLTTVLATAASMNYTSALFICGWQRAVPAWVFACGKKNWRQIGKDFGAVACRAPT